MKKHLALFLVLAVKTKKALAEKRYVEAAELAAELVEKIDEGIDMFEETVEIQAIDEGVGAISQP